MTRLSNGDLKRQLQLESLGLKIYLWERILICNPKGLWLRLTDQRVTSE